MDIVSSESYLHVLETEEGIVEGSGSSSALSLLLYICPAIISTSHLCFSLFAKLLFFIYLFVMKSQP